MIRCVKVKAFILLCFICTIYSPAHAYVHVAVASNFLPTLKLISDAYYQKSGSKVIISSASTGKLYGQITNGAPFTLFLAADQKRIKMLKEKLNLSDERVYTYAIGRIAILGLDNAKDLAQKAVNAKYFALANPKFAPYGKAAKEALISLGVWNIIRSKILKGENISQVHHFVNSGGADLGAVALSQVLSTNQSYWVIPASHHSPIKQDMLVITADRETSNFVKFIKSKDGQKIIKQYGYDLNGI